MYTILVGCPASCGCYCVCVLSRRAGSIMQLFIHSTFERPGGFGQHHQLVYVKVAACLDQRHVNKHFHSIIAWSCHLRFFLISNDCVAARTHGDLRC